MTVAFWVLAILLAYSALGLARALLNKTWYEQQAYRSRVEPHLGRTILVKLCTIAIGLIILYSLGQQIGYFA
jgi:hypothetical protein